MPARRALLRSARSLDVGLSHHRQFKGHTISTRSVSRGHPPAIGSCIMVVALHRQRTLVAARTLGFEPWGKQLAQSRVDSGNVFVP
jgi:hypothetical protein